MFWRLRSRLVRTALGQLMATARLRLSLVILLGALLWIVVFQLLHEGFNFLEATVHVAETRDLLLHTIFAMFFGALLAMLCFSAGIILYSSLFRSREVAMLLTLPAREPGSSCTSSRRRCS